MFIFFFFFFQAEDGIRDADVTGVQTCALPISRREPVDEQQRQNLCDDLRGILKGQLLFDDLTRALYSTDASIFQVQPLGVVVPQDEEDVQNLVRYAAEHKIPLIPRGAGSGVAGESLGSGLYLE